MRTGVGPCGGPRRENSLYPLAMRFSRLRSTLVAAAGVLVLLCVACWPALSQFRTRFWGDDGDALQNLWNGWWMRTALARGEWPMFTDALSHPHGVSLWLHTFGPFNALVTGIGQAALPGFLGFNLTVLLQILLAGLGAFVLARHLIMRAVRRGQMRGITPTLVVLSALVAGVAFAFNSYMWSHLPGHLHCLSIGPTAFFTHALIRSTEKRGWQWPVASGVWALITILCGFYVFVDLLILGAGVVAASIATKRARRTSQFRSLGLALGMVALTCAPVALATMHANSQPLDGTHDPRIFSADIESFVIPNASEYLGMHYFPERARSYTGWWEVGSYVGVIVTLLALFGFATQRTRMVGGLLLSGIVGAVLALGPVLHVGGVVHDDIHLPYYYLARVLPIVDALGCPVRFTVVLTLALAVAAALGVAHVASRIYRTRAGRILGPLFALVAIALVFAERLPSGQVGSDLPTRSALSVLRDSHDEGAVLDMTGWYWPLYNQTVHGHALVGSYTSRRPIAFVQEIDHDPVVGPLMNASLAGRRNEHFVEAMQRIDSNIDFNWGARSPSPNTGVDFRVRWEGTLAVPSDGEYEFLLGADDAASLSLDGRVVVDNGGRHEFREVTRSVSLPAGPHALLLTFEDVGADARVRLMWKPPGAAGASVISGANLQTTAGEPGLRGRYEHRAMSFSMGATAARERLRHPWGIRWVIAEERDQVTLGGTLGLVERGRGEGIVLWEVPAAR